MMNSSQQRSEAQEGLLAQAQRVLALAESVRDAQRVAKKADSFSERRGHIQDLLGSTVPLAITQQLFVDAGIKFPGSPRGAGTYSNTAQQFTDVRLSFEDDPESLFGNEFRTARDRAANIATGLEKRLRQGWAEYVEATVPTHDPDQLDVFAEIPAFREAVHRLRSLYRNRASLVDKLPVAEEGIQAPRVLAEEIDDAWSRLGGGAPPPVLDLLRAAGTRSGAPLHAYTSEVRQWLDERGLTDALRIRLAS